MGIDKSSKLPFHTQIYHDVLKEIEMGNYRLGEKIPAEPELQKMYDVSRITVRRAIQDLEIAGYLEKLRGIGTIVTEPKQSVELKSLTSFSEDIERGGGHSSSIINDFREMKAPLKVMKALNLKEGDEVYYLERLRLNEQMIVGINKAYLKKTNSLYFEEGEINEKTTLYGLLKEKNIKLQSAEETLEARLPSKELQKKLKIDSNQAVFYRERVTKDVKGEALEYVEINYRADHYQYKLHLNIED